MRNQLVVSVRVRFPLHLPVNHSGNIIRQLQELVSRGSLHFNFLDVISRGRVDSIRDNFALPLFILFRV